MQYYFTIKEGEEWLLLRDSRKQLNEDLFELQKDTHFSSFRGAFYIPHANIIYDFSLLKSKLNWINKSQWIRPPNSTEMKHLLKLKFMET